MRVNPSADEAQDFITEHTAPNLPPGSMAIILTPTEDGEGWHTFTAQKFYEEQDDWFKDGVYCLMKGTAALLNSDDPNDVLFLFDVGFESIAYEVGFQPHQFLVPPPAIQHQDGTPEHLTLVHDADEATDEDEDDGEGWGG